MEAKDYEPTWSSCRKIFEEAIYTLPVFKNIETFELLLNWKFAYRCYTTLSLYHFCKGGYFDESNRALVIDALRRAQEVMSIVFGNSFRDVFTTYIDSIMDLYGQFDGEYLRYMAEEVLYRYGIIMGEAWTATQVSFYNIPNLHEPGNAARLLATMFSKITPDLSRQQEYLRSVSTKIVRTTLPKPNAAPQIHRTPIKKKKGTHPPLVKPPTKIQTPSKLSKGSLCLTHLKFKLGMTQVDCPKITATGRSCGHPHRTPTKGNKKEFQQIIGQAGHPGGTAERGQIHLELAKL